MRIVAAISGGVDSAVAAARLVRAGEDVIGLHLRTGVEAEGAAAGGARSCCGADDARDARAIADHLDIPFYVVDVREAFATVIEDFVASYAAGRTPSPCTLCNQRVKFGRLVEIAQDLGAATIATGHYARVEDAADGRRRLLVGRDPSKDQSYMLYRLSQAQLRVARFPLGDTPKADVRDEARRHGFAIHDKPDSQELCFVPASGHRGFLRERAPEAFVPGTFVDGDVDVGAHDGAVGFTLGQRRGLPAVGSPRYVTQVEPSAGRVTLGTRNDVMKRTVCFDDVNWIDVPDAAQADLPRRVDARVRHGRSSAGTLHRTEDGLAVTFDEDVFAPAPGQALVAYVGDAVLCGGTISSSHAQPPARTGNPDA